MGEQISLKIGLDLVSGSVVPRSFLVLILESEFAVDGLIANVIALVITAGTIWQRKFSQTLPLATNNAFQALSATVFHGFIMWWIEDPAIEFTLFFGMSMGWLVIAVSFGAFSILMYLINHNSASQTSALFFGATRVAIIGWMLLNEGRRLLI